MSGMTWDDAAKLAGAHAREMGARRSALAEREAARYADDPFIPTPPTPAEQAQVGEGVALLTVAADPNRLFVAAGNPERWLPELSALLADLAREAGEVGPNPWAVALARKIVGEER